MTFTMGAGVVYRPAIHQDRFSMKSRLLNLLVALSLMSAGLRVSPLRAQDERAESPEMLLFRERTTPSAGAIWNGPSIISRFSCRPIPIRR